MSDEALRALLRTAETENDRGAWTRLGHGLLRAGRSAEATHLLVRQRARGVDLPEVEDALEPTSLDAFRIRNLAPRHVAGEHPALAWAPDGERLFVAGDSLRVFKLENPDGGGYPDPSGNLRGHVHAIASDLEGRRLAVAASLARPETGSTRHNIERSIYIFDLATGALGEPLVHSERQGPAQVAWWGDPRFVFVSEREGVAAYEVDPAGALVAPPAWSVAPRSHWLTERGAVVSWRPVGEIVEAFGARDPVPFGLTPHLIRCGTTRGVRAHAARCAQWKRQGTPAPRLLPASWVSPTGRFAAAITERTRLELMDLAGTPRSRVFALEGQTTHVGVWSPSGRRFATASAAGVFVIEA